MQFLPLLGKSLRDDDVIDVLDSLEMDVIYDFDRLHEGQPDQYWASAKEAGIQLNFNAAQTLDTIFLHIAPSGGFGAFSPIGSDISIFATVAAAEAFGDAHGLQVSKGTADFLGVSRDWVRLGFVTHSVHYEFRGGGLALVTIQRSKL